MLDGIVRGRKAWTRDTIRTADYLVPIPAACLGEIDAFVDGLRFNPLPTELLDPAEFSLPKTRTLMRRVKRGLDDGAGFAVLDRLPVDRFDKAEIKAVYWLLSSMMARPVAQAFRGTMLYDVRDTGKRKGPEVRADLTKDSLSFHTDYGYNLPPPYIGLQVLRTAKQGGRSTVVSLCAAHNEMRRRQPQLLPRLYRPFYLNRYSEHAPGEPVASAHPVFAYDGKTLRGRFNLRNITAGYDMAGEPLDAEGADAIAALSEVLEDPGLTFEFDLAPGQIQYLMNWGCAHSRTAYEDYPEPDRKRHLVRIFLRDTGARSYMG
jgi:alpha-ketoglutarate-dependent taurine dioxygenase